MTKSEAERFFKRKASADSNLPPRKFLEKKLGEAMKSISNYGRNVKGGAKIVGKAIKRRIKI